MDMFTDFVKPQVTARRQPITEHRGFPNPATDSTIVPLSLDKLLVKRPLSTFFMRIESREWEQSGIFSGDTVIIDRSLSPRQNDLVVWWEGESFVLSHQNRVPFETPIWGVVSSVVHQYRR